MLVLKWQSEHVGLRLIQRVFGIIVSRLYHCIRLECYLPISFSSVLNGYDEVADFQVNLDLLMWFSLFHFFDARDDIRKALLDGF